MLRRLLPSVLPRLALGTVFLAVVDDGVLRRSIGVLLLVMGALQITWRFRAPSTGGVASSRGASIAAGAASGFATMMANASGPVMTLYLVAQGAEKGRFIGTAACCSSASTSSRCPSAPG